MTSLTRPIDLMKAGTFNPANGEQITISIRDLEEIAAATNTVIEETGWTPPAYQGHSDRPDIERPMFGRLSKLRVEGGKLLADFTARSQEVFDGLKQGFFDERSVEVYEDVTRVSGVPDGVRNNAALKGRQALKGVAFLGSSNPAIKGLEPLSGLLALGEGQVTIYTFTAEGNALGTDPGNAGESDNNPNKEVNMPETTVALEAHQDLKRKFEEIETTLEQVTKERDALKAKTQEQDGQISSLSEKVTTITEAADKRIAALEEAAERRDLESWFTEMKRQGKVHPHEEELIDTLLALDNESKTQSFGEGDKKVANLTHREKFQRIVEARQKVTKFSDMMEHGDESGSEGVAPKGVDPDSWKKDRAVIKFAEEHKIDVKKPGGYLEAVTRYEQEVENG